jgi:hypothetical protein
LNRPKDDLLHTFSVLSLLNEHIPMTLSLNEHEGKILFSYMGRDFTWDEPLPDTEKDMEYVRRQTGLDELIIHTPFFALGASADEGTAIVKQRNAEETIITTGAGDNFNGGYLSACVQKGVLSFRERLFTANAVTGSYVRNGISPDKMALKLEMDELVKIMEESFHPNGMPENCSVRAYPIMTEKLANSFKGSLILRASNKLSDTL